MNPVSRRTFLRVGGGGAVVVSFSMMQLAQAQAQQQPQATPPTPAQAQPTEVSEQQPVPSPVAAPSNPPKGTIDPNQVDSWLAVGQDGKVTIFSGRVELGTGTQTALAQIAADELYVPFENISMVTGDTARAPDEGYTAGSKTIQVGGVNVRKAAAEARQALLEMASAKLGVAQDGLSINNGAISSTSNPSQSVTFGDLIGGQVFKRQISDQTPLKDPSLYTIVGQPVQRVDLPAKIFGQAAYVQDLKLPGMLHGRTIHPGAIGATVQSVDQGSVSGIADLVKVVQNGSFLGVVAQSEWGAIQAARKLAVTWTTPNNLPDQASLADWIQQQQTSDKQPVNNGDVDGVLSDAQNVLHSTFTQPYQNHVSIGPSCAVADVQSDHATVYSSTQGVYPLRGAIAQLIGMPADSVHVVHMEGAGCYGHNGFDDAAGEAALLSQAVGKPVRLQWMRQDEHVWEPHGPAMVVDIRGAVNGGKVSAWDYQVWTPTHSTRPGGFAANLLPGQLVSPPPPAAENGLGGGDRNAPTNYTFDNNRVTVHWLSNSPIRVSALRSLGAMANTFANESFMDELAYAAGVDPVQFRLNHLDDPRGIAVLQAAANQIGWQPHTAASSSGRGLGIAYARYENTETYVAAAADVSVDSASGKITLNKIAVAHDAGLVINPDGLKNQIIGNVIQSASRAILEQVNFDNSKITSVDWRSYPILRFQDIPPIDVTLINHPDQPAWGAGEITTLVTPPAIANAIYHATGQRMRSVPLNPGQGAQRGEGGEGGRGGNGGNGGGGDEGDGGQ